MATNRLAALVAPQLLPKDKRGGSLCLHVCSDSALCCWQPCLPAQALSKDERRGAPIFAVIDQPGKSIKDKGYLWIEVRLLLCWGPCGLQCVCPAAVLRREHNVGWPHTALRRATDA
jgi:hypothetical protein